MKHRTSIFLFIHSFLRHVTVSPRWSSLISEGHSPLYLFLCSMVNAQLYLGRQCLKRSVWPGGTTGDTCASSSCIRPPVK